MCVSSDSLNYTPALANPAKAGTKIRATRCYVDNSSAVTTASIIAFAAAAATATLASAMFGDVGALQAAAPAPAPDYPG